MSCSGGDESNSEFFTAYDPRQITLFLVVLGGAECDIELGYCGTGVVGRHKLKEEVINT